MLNIREERMSAEFTKFHVYGLGRDVVFHRFTAPDVGGPHDHPWAFKTTIISGGYVERVYHLTDEGGWWSQYITRLPGSTHTVQADCIHEIVQLLEPVCWTMVLPCPWERETRFWTFTPHEIRSIQHDER